MATSSAGYTIDKAIFYLPGEASGYDDYAREKCVLDLYRPVGAEGFGTVVYFHGGGLFKGEPHMPQEFMNRGWAIAAPTYRLHPKVSHPVYIQDAAAAVAWVVRNIREKGGDPGRVVVGGFSAGAYLALMLALDKQYLAELGVDADAIAGVLPMSGQVVTHQTIRKEQGIEPSGTKVTVDRFAPLFHMRPDAPAMCCITGDWALDILCRAEENLYFVSMMKLVGHKDISHVVVPGVGHEHGKPGFWPPAVAFLERVLDGQARPV
jgi:pimeloyl-ACP methyl ester carboxylesterase